MGQDFSTKSNKNNIIKLEFILLRGTVSIIDSGKHPIKTWQQRKMFILIEGHVCFCQQIY